MLYVQRSLNFEETETTETAHVAEATSRPPPELVFPDRQLTYGGSDPSEWPKRDEHSDQIAVDREREDIDGPAHRFLVEPGDQVEVYLGDGRFDVGTVTEINHDNQSVCVSGKDGCTGEWFEKERIYPAPSEDTETHRSLRPKIEVADFPATESTSTRDEPCQVSATPDDKVAFRFDDFNAFHRKFQTGFISFAEYREQFQRLCSSENSLRSELKSRFKARELMVIALRLGCLGARRNTKDENVVGIVQRMLSSFLLDGTVSYSMGERFEDAVRKKVLSVTAEEYVAAFEKRVAERHEREKALSNPETFYEFRTFLLEKSEDGLSDEHLARYDALHADTTRERRASEQKTTVEKFQNEELTGFEFQIKEGFHEKREAPLWIVQLTTRVERATFNELSIKAKQLGGWYSSFKKADAGFQFLGREQAERFVGLLEGNADWTDILEARKARQEQSAAERLHELAEELLRRADETLERSNEALQNTARRADIQAGVRGRAFADQALARTMHSIAEALSRGEARYLDGIRHKSQVETLDTLLGLAKWARIRKVNRPGEDYARQPNLLDVRFAEYPYPSIYKRHLEEIVFKCRSSRGAKQGAHKMAGRLARESYEYVTFQAEHDIEALEDLLGQAKATGVDTARIELSFEKYKRLKRANITDVPELRAALREYLQHRAEARGDNPVKTAERELIGKKLPGFFPTPATVIERMLDLAEIAPHHLVLEPSCGKGDILDAIKNRYPDVRLHAIEQNLALADILSAKGHDVEFGDFLKHQVEYDRILMNPPFDADTIHVRHAYELLHPGGQLVSVVSEGPFFRADKKFAAFREWLEEVGAEVEQLPDDAFSGSDAFRQTSVRTRLVIIDRVEHEKR